MKRRDTEEPPVRAHLDILARLFLLRQQPAQVGMVNNPGWIADASLSRSHPAANEPLSGEEGHLGVIRNGAGTAIGGRVIPQTRLPEPVPDIGERKELDGRTKSIAHGATQERPPNSICR